MHWKELDSNVGNNINTRLYSEEERKEEELDWTLIRHIKLSNVHPKQNISVSVKVHHIQVDDKYVYIHCFL